MAFSIADLSCQSDVSQCFYESVELFCSFLLVCTNDQYDTLPKSFRSLPMLAYL